MLLLYAVWKECQRFIQAEAHGDAQLIARCVGRVSLNAAASLALFAAISALTVLCESHYTQLSPMFTCCTQVCGFLAGAVCWLFVLYFMFKVIALQPASEADSESERAAAAIDASVSKSLRYKDDGASLVASVRVRDAVYHGLCDRRNHFGAF